MSNLFLEGDNLNGLYFLRQEYLNKIKMIYIDPPYNTGTKRAYKDRYNNGAWKSMMYPRLCLARDLLKDDGAIFISIDDNEVAHLRLICDEIFGEGNFVGCFVWKKRTIKNDAHKGLSTDTESIICYAKSQFNMGRDVDRKYYKTDDFEDRWRLHPLTKHCTASERPNSFFTIKHNGKEWEADPNRVWRVTKDTYPKYLAEGRIVFPGDYPFLKISKPCFRVWESDYFGKKACISNLLDAQVVKMTGHGTKEIIELFGTKVFMFPKPTALIKHLIEIALCANDDIILDFFAGSCTTAHAVMKLNKEDNGNRKFIMIQLDEPCDPKSDAFKSGYKTIADIGYERILKAAKALDYELEIEKIVL